MNDKHMGTIESKFAEVIWEKEPIGSGELVKFGAEMFGWKKATTYTVLRRLCEKGLFKNEDSVVTSLMTKEEYHTIQSEKFINETFEGSLPAFFAAFTSKKKLSQAEVDELHRLIDGMGESK